MNLSGLLPIFDQLPVFDATVKQIVAGEHDAPTVLHLPLSARGAVLARVLEKVDCPILFLSGRIEAVARWQETLERWLPPQKNALRFPEPTPLPFERAPWSENSRFGRLTVLTRLMAGQHPLLPALSAQPLIITSVRALLQKTLPKRNLLTSLKILKLGQVIDLHKTLAAWEEIGYQRVSVVESPCQFSQRGGIIDVFPASSPYPVRVELFGNEVDTLRHFDPATQRSVAGAVQRIVIPPAREALPKLAVAVGEHLQATAPEKYDDLPSWQDDIEDLLSGVPSPHLEFYLPYIYHQPASLLDYLPKNTLIVVDDWVELQMAVRDVEGKAAQMAGEQRLLPEDMPSPLFAWDTIAAKLTAQPLTVLGEVEAEPAPPAENAPLELADLVQSGPRHGGQERPFMAQLQRAQELEQRTVVVSRQAQRLAEMWRGNRVWSTVTTTESGLWRPLDSIPQLPVAGSLTFVTGTLGEGFVLEDARGKILLNLISDAEIFGWNRPAPRRRRIKRAVAPETYFADIEPGDLVVHIEYGIGRFQGMVVRSIGGADREYLQLQYANSDVLYIPVHHADRLSKWVGSEFQSPSLHRVGEKRWKTAKARAQKAVNDLADELLELYAAREAIHGHAFARDNDWQAELEASFPYEETEDQLKAVEEVKADMERDRPMDRLICGDVGFGKTEVALRAAFKAVMDEKQVAILVPTTVLAQQHYNTFRQRLTPFPVEVGLLSRFQSPQKLRETVKGLRNGSVDIVIGTHRLLSDDVSFKDLGLLIIDEEQRFGVSHKVRLKQMRTEVDVLTMTATPIPRTLYMGLSGMRDISIINTPPNERLPIQTYVGASDETLIKRAILRELDRGGQIFFVHNHVSTIESARRKLNALVPDARVAIGHGQMDERRLEKVMKQFGDHQIDILVSTTIIESGLDIPNANTLIVDRAELFGLSQMYQLRGRVGRGTQRAYAYFFHAPWRQITPEARARLETIDEHQELGAGYSIAMRDLEIRGAGELLGDNQSGHLANVGFDLYMRMLAQAVKARKAGQEGKKISAELSPAITIDLPMPAYIPTDYVPDGGLRLRLYRRMAGLAGLEEIEEISAELLDRFGPLPAPINNLLYQLRVKLLAGDVEIEGITTENHQIRVRKNFEYVDRASLQRYLGEGVRVSKSAVWLSPDFGTKDWQTRLTQILEKLAAAEDGISRQPFPS